MVPRILIVDDEQEFVELVQYRLAGLGCEFIVASNGVQALSQARQFKPDLILPDILLPDLEVCPSVKFCAASRPPREPR